MATNAAADEAQQARPRRILVASDLRVTAGGDGYWTATSLDRAYWSEMFGGGNDVTLLLRLERGDGHVRHPMSRIDGDGVEVVPLPTLRPGLALPGHVIGTVRALWREGRQRDSPVVLYLPGVVGSLFLMVLTLQRRPFGVRLVGDPLEATTHGGVGGRLRWLVGAVLVRVTRRACRRAVAVSYVTDSYLQGRYPPGASTATFACSNVNLGVMSRPPERPSPAEIAREPMVLMTVAALSHPYKRVDLLLDALAVLRNRGLDVVVEIIGDGVLRPQLERHAVTLGVADQVTFKGAISDRQALMDQVAAADLFVLCSDTEGMPRALIEAMALGTPCVGTRVGGVQELLPAAATAPRGDVDALAAVIEQHLLQPDLWHVNRGHCLERAEDFAPGHLEMRRRAFVAALRRA
ncbi:MAG TPA: glycosyltransferase [Acidimicrobiales bacterium]|nr:glycosyltransferase [Acidimicrobiales bacterium]